jgi:hypothetical protein
MRRCNTLFVTQCNPFDLVPERQLGFRFISNCRAEVSTAYEFKALFAMIGFARQMSSQDFIEILETA